MKDAENIILVVVNPSLYLTRIAHCPALYPIPMATTVSPLKNVVWASVNDALSRRAGYCWADDPMVHA